MLSAGCNKLASTIATSGVVAILIYYIMMGNYNGLYIPMYVLSFIFMAIFFLVGAKTAGRKGQKRAITQYTAIAFLFYIGLVILLSVWDPNNSSTHLSLIQWADDGSIYFQTNLITIVWIVLFGCGYGAYNLVSEMAIPMIADCTDYETYRSGKYVPGIMGTIFSLVDKFVSSFSSLFISVFTVTLIPGLKGALPSTGLNLTNFDYSGVKLSAIITFCLLPMTAWLITLFCMRFYNLNGAKLREDQSVNAIRKAAMNGGMPKEEAMLTWKTIDQVPAEYVQIIRVRKDKKTGLPIPNSKENIVDKIYNNYGGKRKSFHHNLQLMRYLFLKNIKQKI